MARHLITIILFTIFQSVIFCEWNLDTSSTPERFNSKKIWVALTQKNTEILENIFWSVSDPKSDNYGKYLSREEISRIISPGESVIQSVVNWITNNGGFDIRISQTRDLVTAHVPIIRLEKMLKVKFSTYTHEFLDRKIIRTTDTMEIPLELRSNIDLIHGVSDFPPMMTRKKNQVNLVFPKNIQFQPGVPIIERVASRANSKRLTISFTPVCLDGNYAINYNCNDTLTTITTTGTYRSKVYTNSWTPNPENCEISQISDTSVTCATYLDVDTYAFVTGIKITATFGNKNFTANYEFPAVATPPVTPETLWQQYGIPNNLYVEDRKFSQCVVEFEQQYYSPEDLKKFFEEMGIPPAPVTVIGPNNASQPGGEANLDIQWIMAMAPGVPTVFWSIAANSSEEIDDILTWAYAIGNMSNPPIVNSLSYGMVAKNVDTYLGIGYMRRSDIEFMKLALQGITIIIADGDNGAGDLGDPPMLSPTCTNSLNPDWPSQSPYVTAVGSTYLTPLSLPICYLNDGVDCLSGDFPRGEVGVSLDNGLFWSTGGGFANTQSQPTYQHEFVSEFLHTPNLPPASIFNSSGRAYPDVAACGHNLMTVISGEFIPVDGTSASAPIFAGIISLLNQVRINNSAPPLGFLNPLLYEIKRRNTASFYDVVVGQNKCSIYSPVGSKTPSCCPAGFSAEIGWDAVTGLGTPNFSVLKEEVLVKNWEKVSRKK